MPQVAPVAGVDFTPPKAENGEIPPFVVGGNSAPYLDDTRAKGFSTWWERDVENHIQRQIILLNIVAQNRLQLAKAA
jgi:hypothetical protein